MREPEYSVRHVFIAADPESVFREVSDVERWPAWAIHNVKAVRRQPGGTFAIETPRGAGTIRMLASKEGGILDHEFVDPVQGAWYVPARVTSFVGGALFCMALAKPPGISSELFGESMRQLDEELEVLKRKVEGRAND